MAPRPGVAMVAVVIIIVLVVSLGAGVYLVVTYNSGTGKVSTSTERGTASNTVSISSSTTTQNANQKSYTGQYSYTDPVGPSGDRYNNRTNGVDVYNSTVSASGTFSFFIDSVNQSGRGTGHGTLTVTTKGYCSGTITVPYAFVITDATTLLGGNLTIAFGDPSPADYTLRLSCIDINNSPYQITASDPYLSVYPNLVSSGNLPGTITETLSAGFYYQIIVS